MDRLRSRQLADSAEAYRIQLRCCQGRDVTRPAESRPWRWFQSRAGAVASKRSGVRARISDT